MLLPGTGWMAMGAASANGGTRREGILLVDDDRILVDLLAVLVEQAGFTPLLTQDPTAALIQFEQHDPLLAVIDLNLKPHDGFDLLAELRRRTATMPILVLTARVDEDDKVRALDLGADDYIVKPFAHREFIARLRAHGRRSLRERGLSPAKQALELGPLQLNVGEHTLQIGTDVFHLTGTEFRLLQFLMRHGTSVVPTADVAKHVWGYDDPPARDAVRVTVHRLRRKLSDGAKREGLIHTVPGVGLQLDTAEQPTS